jgi:hypothetical protein
MRALILVVVFAGFGSCRQHINSVQLREINEGFVRANNIITNTNDEYYHKLDMRMADPEEIQRLRPFYPAVRRVFTLSQEMRAYIGRFDSLLEPQHELPASAKIALFDSLVSYRKNLLTAFDSSLRAENQEHITERMEDINRHCKLLIGYANPIRARFAKEWIDSVLGSSDPTVIRLMLDKIQNDISTEEYMRVTYVEMITKWEADNFLEVYPWVTLKPDEAKAGQEIEVSAGIIGGYIDLQRLEVTIDGERTAINDNVRALAVRKIRAGDIPGDHVIPVTIEMTYRNGDSLRSVHMLKYRVRR